MAARSIRASRTRAIAAASLFKVLKRGGLARAVQQGVLGQRMVEPQAGPLQDALARSVDAQQHERCSRGRGGQQPELLGARHCEIESEERYGVQRQRDEQQARQAG